MPPGRGELSSKVVCGHGDVLTGCRQRTAAKKSCDPTQYSLRLKYRGRTKGQMCVSVELYEEMEEELRGLVQHSVILALPGCAPAVESRMDSRNMISRASPRRPRGSVGRLRPITFISMSLQLISPALYLLCPNRNSNPGHVTGPNKYLNQSQSCG